MLPRERAWQLPSQALVEQHYDEPSAAQTGHMLVHIKQGIGRLSYIEIDTRDAHACRAAPQLSCAFGRWLTLGVHHVMYVWEYLRAVIGYACECQITSAVLAAGQAAEARV
jgi:hypothetical protein